MKNWFIAFFLLLFFHSHVNAQQPVYKNLVLEGGGVRGLAYGGALEVLDSLGVLQNIERIGGTSAGAIQAMLFAIGFKPKDITSAAAYIPLRRFNDGFVPAGFWRMSRKFGFFKGEQVGKWLEELIALGTGDANITFKQLHDQRLQKGYKDLYITGTDLTYRCLRVFSYESYPNMKVKDAVRISLSIPLYFEPLIIDDNGMVQKQYVKGSSHLMVDGGLLSNYPIQLFDSTRYFSIDTSAPNTYSKNPSTLGLLLDKPEQVAYQQGIYPLPIHSLSTYLSALYQTIIDKPDPDVNHLKRTVIISHLNLSGRVRRLKKSTIEKLVESGREGVRKFFISNNDSVR